MIINIAATVVVVVVVRILNYSSLGKKVLIVNLKLLK